MTVPLEPQAIADWADSISFDRFDVDFASIPATVQTGVNVAIATGVFDDTIVGVVSDVWVCKNVDNFECQDQLGQY